LYLSAIIIFWLSNGGELNALHVKSPGDRLGFLSLFYLFLICFLTD